MLLESQWISGAERLLDRAGIGLLHQLRHVPLPLAPVPLVRSTTAARVRRPSGAVSADTPRALRPNQASDFRSAAERAVERGCLAARTIERLPQRLPAVDFVFGCCAEAGGVQLHPTATPIDERVLKSCKYSPRRLYCRRDDAWYLDGLAGQGVVTEREEPSPALAPLAFTEFCCTSGYTWESVQYDALRQRGHNFNSPLVTFHDSIAAPDIDLRFVTRLPDGGWRRSSGFLDFMYGTCGTITVLDPRRALWARSLVERSFSRSAERRTRVLTVELAEAFPWIVEQPEGCHIFLAFCREGSRVENYQFGNRRTIALDDGWVSESDSEDSNAVSKAVLVKGRQTPQRHLQSMKKAAGGIPVGG